MLGLLGDIGIRAAAAAEVFIGVGSPILTYASARFFASGFAWAKGRFADG